MTPPRCQPANWVTGYGTSTSAALGATTGTGWLLAGSPRIGQHAHLAEFYYTIRRNVEAIIAF